MAARCASCSYPLSVSDSVSCCECFSYFHIDCAQLVGFPYYELSSDPIRNTFHCQTCKILPLPQNSNSFSDSDSDGECTMPSRQLDYHLEGQPDFAKDMNEVKGTVQDLSELCKDMFREINELKSINLTLRCCVENLRHDGEQRDSLISELKRRIEALEGKGVVSLFKPINSSDIYEERISIDKEEDAERYLTPDPECARLKEIENLEQECLQDRENQIQEESSDRLHYNLKSYNTNESIFQRELEQPKNVIDVPETQYTEDIESFKTNLNEENSWQTNDEKVHFAEEEVISTKVSKDNTEKETIGSVKDWDWRGNKAVQLEDKEGTNESSAGEEDEEEEENEASDIEDTETQGWEILGEDLKSEFITKNNEEVPQISRSIEESEEEEEEAEAESEEKDENRKVTWADEVEKDDKGEETFSDEETEEIIKKSNDEYLSENSQAEFESKEEESEEHNEEPAAEVADRISVKDEEAAVEAPKIIAVDEIVEGGAEVEGRIDSEEGSRPEGGSRLEGDAAVVEEGAVPEGEATEGGQSPEGQGEVQPSELLEGAEPPPPPLPQHTPDDLWDYLKETVTGEHPATVEEFVQKLIGTLEHVPEEYLKPVIEYNIQRANSPSDGDHLDGEHHLEGENHSLGQTGTDTQQNGDVSLEGGDNTTSFPEGQAPDAEGGGLPAEESAALTTDIPQESSEGYTPLEAPV